MLPHSALVLSQSLAVPFACQKMLMTRRKQISSTIVINAPRRTLRDASCHATTRHVIADTVPTANALPRPRSPFLHNRAVSRSLPDLIGRAGFPIVPPAHRGSPSPPAPRGLGSMVAGARPQEVSRESPVQPRRSKLPSRSFFTPLLQAPN